MKVSNQNSFGLHFLISDFQILILSVLLFVAHYGAGKKQDFCDIARQMLCMQGKLPDWMCLIGNETKNFDVAAESIVRGLFKVSNE